MAVQKYDVRQPNGEFEERFWSPVNKPILDDDGNIKYIVHQVEDVTEFVQSQGEEPQEDRDNELSGRELRQRREIIFRSQELQRVNQQLRQIDKLKSEFLSMVSHEFKTPLAAIDGFTQLMITRWADFSDPEKLQFLGIIEDQSRRLEQLVNNLLTLSRIESKQLIISPQPVSVPLIVNQVVQQLGQEGKVSVISQADLRALIDPTYFNQAISHYVANATKHGQPPIEISITENRRYVEVAVADCGLGVEARLVPHIFELFAHNKNKFGTQAGTVLGLSIAKGLVEAQGGTVFYEPNVPHGAIFKACVPKV